MKSINAIIYILLSWMVVTAQNGQVPTQVHSCGVCRITFKTGKALSNHHKLHTTTPAPFHCGDCGTGFTQQGNLTRHRKRAHPDQLGEGPSGSRARLQALPKPSSSSMAQPPSTSPPTTKTALNHACKVCPIYMYSIINRLYIIVPCFTYSGP